MRRRPALLLALFLLAGCAEADPRASGAEHAADPSLVPDGVDGPFRAAGLVLEDAQHGPELCLGPIQMSDPPQCTGLPLPGWDWSAVAEGSWTERIGSKYGGYVVTGHLRDGAFVLDRPPVPGGSREGRALAKPLTQPPEPAATVPCPTPSGGWTAPDPSRWSDRYMEQAVGRAQSREGHAGVWLVQLPGDGTGLTRYVLVASTTADQAALEASIRQVWGGPLCVVGAERTHAELQRAQDWVGARKEDVGALVWGPHDSTNQLQLDVVVARRSLLESLEREFGVGSVRLRGKLQLVEPAG